VLFGFGVRLLLVKTPGGDVSKIRKMVQVRQIWWFFYRIGAD